MNPSWAINGVTNRSKFALNFKDLLFFVFLLWNTQSFTLELNKTMRKNLQIFIFTYLLCHRTLN
jgi:hypothetical protein